MMRKSYPINFTLSLFIVIFCVTFTIIAFIRFPLPYSPIANWLSDLGNPDVNIIGAVFYNTGITVAGSALMIFFLRLTKLGMANNRLQCIMILLTVIFGCIGSLAIIITAIYPINQPSQHSFWSMILYLSLWTAFAFSVAALRYYARYPRWFLAFGGIVVIVDMIAQIFSRTFLSQNGLSFRFYWAIVYCLELGQNVYP